MWHPRDERKLLAGYYHVLAEVNKSKGYERAEWAKLLKKKLRSWKTLVPYSPDGKQRPKEKELTHDERMKTIPRLLGLMSRLEKANKVLEERGMIGQAEHQSKEVDVLFVSLTLDGYDLGRQYSSFWGWSGLWFREYKNYWLVMLLAVVVTGVLRYLWRRFSG